MREICNLSEIKKIELDILRAFRSFCEKNSLRYFLAYGTLLGAVRHGGFIPWDDDIDVAMPRTDYERFLKEFRDERYEVYDLSKKGYFYPFAKLCDTTTVLIEEMSVKNSIGVYIDIFPMDGIADNDQSQHSKAKRLMKLQQHKCISLRTLISMPHGLDHVCFVLGYACVKGPIVSDQVIY